MTSSDESEPSNVPAWVQEEIDHPLAMGEGRNNQMVRIGPTLLRNGWDPEGLEELFCGMYTDIGPKQEREIHACVRNCVKIAAREQKDFDKSQFSKRRLELDAISRETRAALPQILEQYAWSEAEIRSTMGAYATLGEQRQHFLVTMFDAEDIIWIGAVWQTGEIRSKRTGKVIGNHAGRFMQLQSWLKLSRIGGEFTSHCTFIPGTFSRCNEQVAQRKYLVVESDVLSKDGCGAVFNFLASFHGLTLRAIVDTGGKSLHGWFDWPGDEGLDEWSAILQGLSCDPSTMRPSQPVRLPGIIRPSTKKPQELLYLA